MSFHNKRKAYVTNIVNSFLGEEVITSTNYLVLTKLATQIQNENSSEIGEQLHCNNKAFIGPPVNTCIKSDCLFHNLPGECHNKLLSHANA